VAASARLDAELVRLGRHAAFGVRAERVAPRARVGVAGYREGERPAAPSVQITVPAGASEGAAFVVMGTAALIVGLELAVARLVLAMSVSDPYVLMGAIAVAALVLVVPARAARARRIELGPEEIVVHPPALLPWREATRVKTSRVRALEHRDPHGRATLVARTDDGEQVLLAGLLPAAVMVDLPRVFDAYRALLDAR
jgi:hypothetical protein